MSPPLAAAAPHVSHPLRRHCYLVGLPYSLGSFQRRLKADLARFHARFTLEEVEQVIHLHHIRGMLHLGQQNAVELGAGHCFQVQAGQAGFQAIDANK